MFLKTTVYRKLYGYLLILIFQQPLFFGLSLIEREKCFIYIISTHVDVFFTLCGLVF